jgi:hypothetical protein
MSRGKSENSRFCYAVAWLQLWLKFSMDVCLYMSQNFDFITLPRIYNRFEHHAAQENLDVLN